jgi:predicted transcriptional regulator YdeE
MTSKPTTVQMPDFSLIVVRAENDCEPDIKATWRALESKLSTLKGRKFYGVCQRETGGIVYYAGLEPLSADEVKLLGLPTLSIKGGKYARVKLLDWPKHTDQIGPIFDQLEKTLRTDPERPVLEHYRSHSELHLLAPLMED